MSNIQAAIGCAQMERIDELTKRKRRIFLKYKEAFTNMPEISMNPEREGTINGYWMPTIVFDKSLGSNRERLLEKFQESHIDGRVFFYPLSSLTMFENKKQNVVSYDIYKRAINLPSYHDLDDKNIIRVIKVVKKELFE